MQVNSTKDHSKAHSEYLSLCDDYSDAYHLFFIARPMKSLEDDDKDTDEEANGHWSRRSKLEKASEKMHSAWEKMSERLSSLRQVFSRQMVCICSAAGIQTIIVCLI